MKHRLLGLTFRVSDSVDPEQTPRIYIYNKFPSDADIIGMWTTL